MKTILILLNLLSSYKIVWENTYLQIPLNENTHIYYEMPRAIAYDRYDNVVNTEVYYERGVNHTTLKVVNSLHVKTFKIDYKATFPLIGKESIETIQFEIIDKIEPVFLHIPEISMPVKSKKKTEKEIIEDLMFEDNYYKNEELIIKVRGLDGVNVNYPGDYLITYEIIDPSFNVKKEERYYHVYNNIPPEIKIKQPLKLEYGAKFNYDDYFIFSDTFNSLIDINIDVSKIDFDKLGFYELKINLINEALLTVSEIFHFEIVDTTKPILIVKDKLEFNYQDKVDLKSLIVLVSDNYDKLTKDDVIITGYYDFERLGKYEITYEVNDNSLNKTVLKISFTIVDLTKPEIELLVDEIIINVYDEVINYQEYFNISDNYSSYEDLKISFNDKSINYSKIGSYYLNVEVVDEAKNRKIIDVIIYIKDLTSPLVDKNYDNYIYIDQYGYLEDSYFKKYFTISDNYYSAKEIVLTINEEINFYKSDELIRDFTFTDPGGNYCLVNDVKILVIETRPPILELYTKTYKHYLGEELPDLLEFVKECYDYTDNPDDLVLTFNTNIDVNKIGLYEVSYKAYNKYINNQTTAELKIYVDFVSKNKSEIKNLEVKVGEKIDELNGIKLSKDIVSYEVFPKVVNTDTPGIKKRQYVLYDVRGNFEIIEQEIKVVTINKPLNYNTIIIINGLSFSFLILFTVIKRRKSDLF